MISHFVFLRTLAYDMKRSARCRAGRHCFEGEVDVLFGVYRNVAGKGPTPYRPNSRASISSAVRHAVLQARQSVRHILKVPFELCVAGSGESYPLFDLRRDVGDFADDTGQVPKLERLSIP